MNWGFNPRISPGNSNPASTPISYAYGDMVVLLCVGSITKAREAWSSPRRESGEVFRGSADEGGRHHQRPQTTVAHRPRRDV